jgi:predicted transcriptional regulator
MKKEEVLISDHESIKAAASQILGASVRCVVVVNDQGKVNGVFSEGDILRAIVQGVDLHTPLKSIMQPSFHYMHKKDVKEAFSLFKKFGMTLIPIVDKNFILQDVITIYDVFSRLKFIEGSKT